jgi:hypothetical protein
MVIDFVLDVDAIEKTSLFWKLGSYEQDQPSACCSSITIQQGSPWMLKKSPYLATYAPIETCFSLSFPGYFLFRHRNRDSFASHLLLKLQSSG